MSSVFPTPGPPTSCTRWDSVFRYSSSDSSLLIEAWKLPRLILPSLGMVEPSSSILLFRSKLDLPETDNEKLEFLLQLLV